MASMIATFAWSKIGFATTTPSPRCSGTTAAAGARARTAAATYAHGGTVPSGSGPSIFWNRLAILVIAATVAKTATATAENPNNRKRTKPAALCTAQPREGASGNASAWGKIRRLIDNPNTVQNSSATTAA